MFEYYIILKGNNKHLACREFETLWEIYCKESIKLREVQNILYCFKSNTLINKKCDFLSRLTFTNVLSREKI